MLTLTFDLLNTDKMFDQDLSCTIHLPSMMVIHLVVLYSGDYVGVSKYHEAVCY